MQTKQGQLPSGRLSFGTLRERQQQWAGHPKRRFGVWRVTRDAGKLPHVIVGLPTSRTSRHSRDVVTRDDDYTAMPRRPKSSRPRSALHQRLKSRGGFLRIQSRQATLLRALNF